MLSTLEKNGLTLAAIEKNGLLSKAEKAGVLSLIADPGTPGLINTLGLVAFAAAAALVFVIADDSTAAIAAQVIGASALAGAGVAAFAGASFLEELQK